LSGEVLSRDRLKLGVEGFLLPSIAGGETFVAPAEWLASVTTAPLLGGDLSFSLGGGGPVPPGDAGPITTPRFRFDLGIRYAPAGAPRDVVELAARCPEKPPPGWVRPPECPEADDDHDGIPNSLDKCPNEPEDFDGFQDADGCP